MDSCIWTVDMFVRTALHWIASGLHYLFAGEVVTWIEALTMTINK
jgi:hypothetical protein